MAVTMSLLSVGALMVALIAVLSVAGRRKLDSALKSLPTVFTVE